MDVGNKKDRGPLDKFGRMNSLSVSGLIVFSSVCALQLCGWFVCHCLFKLKIMELEVP